MFDTLVGRVHPVTAKGAATRVHILRVAFELIGEVGWGQITTRLIAQRAGVNNAMVNYHFRSKESLLHQAARLGTAELLAPMLQPLVDAGELRAGMVAMLGSFRDTVTPRQLATLVEILFRGLRDAEVRDVLIEELRAFRALLARLDTRPGRDSEAVGVLMAALTDGLLFHALLDPEIDIGRATAALERLLQ